MTSIQCAERVVAEGMQLIRARQGGKGQYDCKPCVGSKRGWSILDGLTACAIMAVYNALNPEMQVKAHTRRITTLADFALSRVAMR
jgi:hypothetical protein